MTVGVPAEAVPPPDLAGTPKAMIRERTVRLLGLMGDADAKAATMAALTHAAPFIRRQLTSRLTIRRTPDIHFTPDESMAEAAHVLDLMKHLPRTRED